MADELRYQSHSGWLTRMLGGRAAVTAFLAGIAGAAAFVASLVSEWQTMTTSAPNWFYGDGSRDSVTLSVGVDISGYAVPYQLGVLGLLTLNGAVVTRPDLARRLRFATAGLGVGVAGVVVAIVYQLQDALVDRLFGVTGINGYPVPADIQNAIDSMVTATGPGVYFSFGSVVALVAGVWLAGGSARDAAATGMLAAAVTGPASAAPTGATPIDSPLDPASGDAAAPVSPSPVGPPGLPLDRPASGASWPPAQAGFVDGITVTSAEVTDPGGQADILRN